MRKSFRMGSRYMVYWRVYVYSNDLYSLSGNYACSYRDCSPLAYRRNLDEVRRVLDFANQDLSVLLFDTQTEVLSVIHVLRELILDINMKSLEFNTALVSFLGPKTNQFVHELFSFARSPFDDMISYELNVSYSIRNSHQPEDSNVEVMQSFVEFSMCVDEDECVSFSSDVEVEEELLEELDEGSDPNDLNAPLLLELRLMLSERMTENTLARSSSELLLASASANSSGGSNGGAGNSARSGNASNNDVVLDAAMERSMLERLEPDYSVHPRGILSDSSYSQNMALTVAIATARNASNSLSMSSPVASAPMLRAGLSGAGNGSAGDVGGAGGGDDGGAGNGGSGGSGGAAGGGSGGSAARPAGRSPRSRPLLKRHSDP